MAPNNKTIFVAFAAVAVLACLAAPASASPMGASGCDGRIQTLQGRPICVPFNAHGVSSGAATSRRMLKAEELLVGGDRDAHGCIPSAGYSWCASTNSCIRAWETECPPSAPVQTYTCGCICESGPLSTCNAIRECSLAEHVANVAACKASALPVPTGGGARVLAEAPAVPTVHFSAKLSAVLLLALGVVICLFGYQCHSLVFAYSGYVMGYALFAFVYALAVSGDGGATAADLALGGWYAWGAILAGIVLALVGVHSTSAGLNFTGTAVGTAFAGVVYHGLTSGIAGDPQVVAALTWLGCVLVACVLFHAFSKPMLIGGTAALGAFYIVNSAATLGWSSVSISIASGLGLEGSDAAYVVLALLFVLGALVQYALSHGDEFDLHGRRRWYPTRFRYNKPASAQKQASGAPVVAENGTTLVYGV